MLLSDRANQRLYLYAKLTQNALKSLPKPDDPIDVNHLTISVMGTPMSTGSISLHEQNHSVRGYFVSIKCKGRVLTILPDNTYSGGKTPSPTKSSSQTPRSSRWQTSSVQMCLVID